jgi:ectoine hydroxylase
MTADRYPSRVAALPQMLPRRDPVAWASWREGAPLTHGQVADYERDGFLALDGVLDADEVAALR